MAAVIHSSLLKDNFAKLLPKLYVVRIYWYWCSCACWWWIWVATVDRLYCAIPLSNKFSWNIQYSLLGSRWKTWQCCFCLSSIRRADLKMVFHEALSANWLEYFEYLVNPSRSPFAISALVRYAVAIACWRQDFDHWSAVMETFHQLHQNVVRVRHPFHSVLGIACIPWNDTNTSPCHAHSPFFPLSKIFALMIFNGRFGPPKVCFHFSFYAKPKTWTAPESFYHFVASTKLGVRAQLIWVVAATELGSQYWMLPPPLANVGRNSISLTFIADAAPSRSSCLVCFVSVIPLAHLNESVSDNICRGQRLFCIKMIRRGNSSNNKIALNIIRIRAGSARRLTVQCS